MGHFQPSKIVISSFIRGSFPAAELSQLLNHLQTNETSDPASLTCILEIKCSGKKALSHTHTHKSLQAQQRESWVLSIFIKQHYVCLLRKSNFVCITMNKNKMYAVQVKTVATDGCNWTRGLVQPSIIIHLKCNKQYYFLEIISSIQEN